MGGHLNLALLPMIVPVQSPVFTASPIAERASYTAPSPVTSCQWPPTNGSKPTHFGLTAPDAAAAAAAAAASDAAAVAVAVAVDVDVDVGVAAAVAGADAVAAAGASGDAFAETSAHQVRNISFRARWDEAPIRAKVVVVASGITAACIEGWRFTNAARLPSCGSVVW